MGEEFFCPGTESAPVTTTVSDPYGITIREAELADLLSVIRIERASFSQPWPPQAFQGMVGRPGFLVADEGGEVRGYVVADTERPYEAVVGHVKDIAVHPDHRGRGIGRRLLERALVVLASEGAVRVKLEVRASNDRAIALYERYGFTAHHRLSGYYDDGEDALVYVVDFEANGVT